MSLKPTDFLLELHKLNRLESNYRDLYNNMYKISGTIDKEILDLKYKEILDFYNYLKDKYSDYSSLLGSKPSKYYC